MRVFLALLLIILLPPLGYAEYEELTTLKDSSSSTVQKHAKQMHRVDPKYEGVVNFGKALLTIEDIDKLDVDQLTVTSKDYWRAVMEMVPSNPAILFAHAHLHSARGETAHAEAYFLLGSLGMSDDFKKEFSEYWKLKTNLDQRLSDELQIGMQYHDKEKYTKALLVYDDVISQHPNSAWAFYQKGFSYLMMGKANPDHERKMKKMFSECRQRDPFYWQAYQGDDQELIRKLIVLGEKVHPFISGEKRDVESLKAFAEGCEEIGLFSFAAHARWKLTLYNSENKYTHVRKFLNLLGKCGCEDVDFFRDQFNLGEDGLTTSSKTNPETTPLPIH